MRSVIVVTLLLLAPINLVGAESQEGDFIGIQEDIKILDKYSKSIQKAFDRLGDLAQYEEDVLMGTNDWVVVTGHSLEYHSNLTSEYFDSKEFEKSEPELYKQYLQEIPSSAVFQVIKYRDYI